MESSSVREEFCAFVADQLRQELSSAEWRLLDALTSWEPSSSCIEAATSQKVQKFEWALLSGSGAPGKASKQNHLAIASLGNLETSALSAVCPSEPARPASMARPARKTSKTRAVDDGDDVSMMTVDPGCEQLPGATGTSELPAPAREAWTFLNQSETSRKGSKQNYRLTSLEDGGSESPAKREALSITIGAPKTVVDALPSPSQSSSNGFHSRVEAVVRSHNFDVASAVFIMANSVSIGAQTDYMARTHSELLPAPLRAIEVFFCVVFAVELCMRLYVFRVRFFSMQGAMWNYLDFMLVCLQVTEELVAVILDITGGPTSSSSDDASVSGTAPSLLRLLRILRLVRVLRVMRVLRFIGELRALVISVFGCMRPFLWTLVLLFLILYLFAIFFTQLVLNHRVQNGELTPGLESHYGSVFVSLLVLYQAMTGGLDWGNAVSPLIHDISPVIGLVFVLYIAFTSLAMTNVLTGIFVESALLRAKEDRELVVERNAQDLFGKVDVDGDGTITWVEFERQLGNPAVKEYFDFIDMNVADARGIFSLLDTNGNGVLDAVEFVTGSLQLRRAAQSLDLLKLNFETRQAFQAQESSMSRIDGQLKAIVEVLRASERGVTAYA